MRAQDLTSLEGAALTAYGIRFSTALNCLTHLPNATSTFVTSSTESGFMCASGRRETFMSLVISVSTQAWFGNSALKCFHWCFFWIVPGIAVVHQFAPN